MSRPFRRNARELARIAAAGALGISSLAFGGATHAAPITFTIDTVNVELSNVEGVCVGIGCLPTVTTPTPITFELDGVGDSDTIDLFALSISDGPAAGFLSADVAVDLLFSAPSTSNSDPVSGFGTFNAFILAQDLTLTFDPRPLDVIFDNGTQISLEIAGGTDSCRNRLSNGFDCFFNDLSVDVTADTTLQAVPEPGSIALLGAGLLGFVAVRRRRSATAAD